MSTVKSYIPNPRIAAFFVLYPNAQDVFEVEGKKLYMEHFEEQACKDSEIESKPLYQVDDQANATAICPEQYTYLASLVSRPISSVTLGSASTIAVEDTAAAVISMLQYVLAENGVQYESITVTDGQPTEFTVMVKVFERDDLSIVLGAQGGDVTMTLQP